MSNFNKQRAQVGEQLPFNVPFPKQWNENELEASSSNDGNKEMIKRGFLR